MNLYLAAAALAAFALPAAAQQPARSDPASQAAPVPAFKYDSAFAGYRGFREEPLAPWRDANDEVARAGGHAGIFRSHGMQTPAAPAQKPPVQDRGGHR
jgi:hypothetical protein